MAEKENARGQNPCQNLSKRVSGSLKALDEVTTPIRRQILAPLFRHLIEVPSMSKNKWLILLLVLMLVAIFKIAVASNISQNLMDKPESTFIEKITNWVQNALQGEKKKNIDNSRIKTSEPDLDDSGGKNDPLDDWIERLIWCESRGNPDAVNWYDGGTPSFGILQFKTDTFWRYNLKYQLLPNLEKNEVPNIIMDSDVQIRLAKRIISNGGYKNWFNCVKSIGLPPK